MPSIHPHALDVSVSAIDSSPRISRKRKRAPQALLEVADDNAKDWRSPSSKRAKKTPDNIDPDTAGSRLLNNVLRALRCKNLSSIHPEAHVKDNRILIPAVSTRVYNHARGHIPGLIASKRIRLEHTYVKDSKGKCELVITMPTQIHEVMKAFASEIKSQMYIAESNPDGAFIPPSWDRNRIIETGSATLTLITGDKTFRVEPDVSLAFEPGNPFLILEVAVAQSPESVRKKARQYIIGSRGKIAFVVVIMVRRMKRQGNQYDPSADTDQVDTDIDSSRNKKASSSISTLTDPPSDLSQWDVFPEGNPSLDGLDNSTSLADNESLNDSKSSTDDKSSGYDKSSGDGQKSSQDRSLDDTNSGSSLPPLLYTVLDTDDVLHAGDIVYASVFRSIARPQLTTGSPHQTVRIMQPLIEEVEVYPHATTASFVIAWQDIAKSAPAGARESFHVSLEPLSKLAQSLARHEAFRQVDDGFSPLSSGGMDYRPTSSSEEVDFESSGGTAASSMEVQRDPNFSP